jgi:dTDP-4-amino-4,6-dideoxygalactose transaminase
MRPNVGSDELQAIKKVLESKILTESKITQHFENKVAQYVHAKHAVSATSATTALHAVFSCINIKGKKIPVSDFTFPATVDAIMLAGGIPLLVDVDRETMNTTYEIIENSLDNTINCVCPVSIFGNPLEKEIYRLKRKGITIVEDAAPSLGAKLGDRYVGSLADVTCFSFHPRKIITTGEGGMITTNNDTLAEKLKSFKLFGKTKSNFITIGTNYKLSDILSAVGLCQIKKIEKIIQKRRCLARIYDELISKIEFLEPQKPTKNARHTYQSYACYVTRPNFREKIRNALKNNNIESQIGTYALHCLPAFKKTLRKGNLLNSELLYKNSISLPLHDELSTTDLEYICKTIKNQS